MQLKSFHKRKLSMTWYSNQCSVSDARLWNRSCASVYWCHPEKSP